MDSAGIFLTGGQATLCPDNSDWSPEGWLCEILWCLHQTFLGLYQRKSWKNLAVLLKYEIRNFIEGNPEKFWVYLVESSLLESKISNLSGGLVAIRNYATYHIH